MKNWNIKKVLRYLNKAEKGDIQHGFITVEKDSDKTAMLKYLQDFIKDRMIIIHISNKGNYSLEILVKNILEELINLAPNFNLNQVSSRDIVDNFLYYLDAIYEELETNKGIFLIIDDVDGLSKSDEFVNWYKRFADSIEMRNYYIPLYILLLGSRDKFNVFVNQDDSFARIFHYDNMD